MTTRLVYRPPDFFNLKNRDRRIYDALIHVDSLALPTLSLMVELGDEFERWLKEYHIKTIHSGAFAGVPIDQIQDFLKSQVEHPDFIQTYLELFREFTRENE